MLRHEQRYWAAGAVSRGLTLSDQTLASIVAVATLFGAATRDQAMALLTGLPNVSDQPTTLAAPSRPGCTIYPHPDGEYWGALQPDRIGEHLAGRSTRTDSLLTPAVLTAVFDESTPAQAAHAVTVLSRASSQEPHLQGVLTTVLAGVARPVDLLALQLAIQLPDPGPLLAALADALPS